MLKAPIKSRPALTLAAASISYFIVIFNTTAVNVAVEDIARQFGYSASTATWFVDAYVLVLAMFLVIGGRLGDSFGRKRVWTIGLAGVAATAVVIAASPSGELAIAARACMGLFTSLLAPASLSLISVAYPPARRGRALGIWAAVTQAGTVAGPIVGGYLTTHLSWRYIFWLNLPLAAIAFLCALRSTPESRNENDHRPSDVWGITMLAAFPALITIGIHYAGTGGWTSPIPLGLMIAGVVVMLAIPWVEKRVRTPLINIAKLANRMFAGAAVVSAVMYFLYLGVMFIQSLYLLTVLDVSAAGSGLLLASMTGTAAVVSLMVGFIIDRFGHYWPVVVGMCALTVSLLMQSRVTVGASATDLIVPLIVQGIGIGLVFGPVQRAAVNSVENQEQGTANGIISMSRQLGGTLGIGLLSALLTTGIGRDVAPGTATPTEFVAALVPTLTFAAGVAGIGLIVAIVTLRKQPTDS